VVQADQSITLHKEEKKGGRKILPLLSKREKTRRKKKGLAFHRGGMKSGIPGKCVREIEAVSPRGERFGREKGRKRGKKGRLAIIATFKEGRIR